MAIARPLASAAALGVIAVCALLEAGLPQLGTVWLAGALSLLAGLTLSMILLPLGAAIIVVAGMVLGLGPALVTGICLVAAGGAGWATQRACGQGSATPLAVAAAAGATFAALGSFAFAGATALHMGLALATGFLLLQGAILQRSDHKDAAAAFGVAFFTAATVVGLAITAGLPLLGLIAIGAGMCAAVLWRADIGMWVLAGTGFALAWFAMPDPIGATVLVLTFVVLARATGDRIATLQDSLAESEDRVVRRTARIRYLLQDRDEVTALAVHDLQSPIQAIGGLQKTLLHMLRTGKSDPEHMQNALEVAISTSEDLSDRVGSILNAKRPHLGGAGEDATLGTLVRHALAVHALRIDSEGVKVTVDVPGTLSIPHAEEIKDILDVLIDNALHHAGTPPRVSVSAWLDNVDRRIVIAVGDNGTGVPPDRAATIFTKPPERDARVRQGMGLYLAFRRARTLGGTLRYAPSELGGAQFSVHLPVG